MDRVLVQEHHGSKQLSRNKWVFISLLCVTGLGVLSRAPWILSFYYDSFPPQNASLCACQKCLMDHDPLFTELINACPEPLLSSQSKISEETFKWWQRNRDKRTFSDYKKTVEKVFNMFPPSQHLSAPSPNRCRTCAVVGNSGNLNGSRYGLLIDVHDIVIRMNRGPTKGFEIDVGTKTTHRVMYPRSFTPVDNTTRAVIFAFEISDLERLIRFFTPRKQTTLDPGLKATKESVMILSPAFMKYVHFVWLKKKGHYPSTGFLSLILSMHMCDEIDVFGFGADKNGNWHHYFEELKNKRLGTGNHSGKQERKMIEELCQRQKIHWFKGW